LDADSINSDNAMQCLKKLPVLNKDTLRETPYLFISRSARRFKPQPLQTSGTTGTPLTIYWDRGSNVMEFCSIQRLWRWAGFRIGQSFLDLRSRGIFSGRENNLVRAEGISYLRYWKVNGLEFSSDLIDERNVHQYYKVLERFKPRLVRGHPQSIQHLASLIQEKGLDGWSPIAVTTASEALYDFQRRRIEEAWQVPVLDSYGLREHNVFIAQCRRGGYHVFPEYGLCEVLDDQGNSVRPGQEGWIVATGLHNYAQVLLRYNTRDRAVAGDGYLCNCGRTLPIVKQIIGRIDDCIYTTEGKRYSGMSFAFFGRRGIKTARLVQNDPTRVTVQLVATNEFDELERIELLNALRRKVEDKISFALEVVDNITQQTPGKFKFVVSNVRSSSAAGKEKNRADVN
jgi:phenylacetate-CoA ligase